MSSNLKIKRICAWCGKEFIAQKTTTACCSKQCANALYKKRKRDEAIKANNQIVEKKIDEKPIERIKDKPFLSITETAIYLGVTRPTVYGYIKRGELKVTRLGFKYLLKKENIDVLFNNPTEFHIPTKEPPHHRLLHHCRSQREISCKRILDILSSQEEQHSPDFQSWQNLLEQKAHGCLLCQKSPESRHYRMV